MWHWAVQAIGVVMTLQAIQPPAPTGRVNDFAGVLSAESEAVMTRIAEDVLAKSGGEIAVVTIADIGSRQPEEWALQIGRQWGVGARANPGDRARNAGVVILLVPKETNSEGRGHCRIEVGQGAEGFITDATTGEICREATPYFAAGDYSRGLTLVTARVAQRFATEFAFQLDTTVAPAFERQPGGVPTGMPRGISIGNTIFVLFIVILILQSMGGRRRRRRGGCSGGGCFPIFIPMGGGGWGGHRGGGWGGGGGGFGGFGGFGGGGGFSGGGGGSSW